MDLTEIAKMSLAELHEAKTAVNEALDKATKEEQDAYVALSRAENVRRALQREWAAIDHLTRLRETQAKTGAAVRVTGSIQGGYTMRLTDREDQP